MEEFINYISNFITIEEIFLAGIGLIIIIIIFIIGGKEQEKMKSTHRKVDELGRVTIPIEFRKKLGIETKNNLTMVIDENRIILEKGAEVDELGRVTIPFFIRKSMEINAKDEVEIEVLEDKLIFNKKVKNVE